MNSPNRQFMHIFFFSSRRRHTRLQGDWSSDVCSSDLSTLPARTWCSTATITTTSASPHRAQRAAPTALAVFASSLRSEERRVGKECRYGWRPDDKKKKKKDQKRIRNEQK